MHSVEGELMDIAALLLGCGIGQRGRRCFLWRSVSAARVVSFGCSYNSLTCCDVASKFVVLECNL